MIRRKRKRRSGISKFKAGMIGVIVLAVFTYGGFTKFANPFASPFTVHAIVPNANNLSPNSLVRIAGVNVGKVESISQITSSSKQGAADVTMTISDNGLPLHSDATFWIRPRTFLEGNFFVDVSPGSPSAPAVSAGHTFPIQQTRDPVQIDQILSSLQANTRANLQTLLKEYGSALHQSAQSFNNSIQYWLPAYKYSAIVGHDMLGLQPHDLSNAIYEQGTVSGAINSSPPALENLITDFNTTAAAFARQNVALQNAVGELPRTLSAAMPAFTALNKAFPPLRALARTLIPGVQSTGPMIDASLPFINQLRLLVQPSELRGLAHDLAGTIPSLTHLTKDTIPLMKNEVRPASSCVTNVVIPWTKMEINDPNFNASNGFPARPAYVELLQLLPGIAGESRTFDANGPIIRLLFGGGTFTYSLQPGQFGTLLEPITGVQPQPPPNDERPPLEENVPCETQPKIASLDAPQGSGPTQVHPAALSAAGQALNLTSAKLLGAEVSQILKQTGSSLKLGGTWAPSSSPTNSNSTANNRKP